MCRCTPDAPDWRYRADFCGEPGCERPSMVTNCLTFRSTGERLAAMPEPYVAPDTDPA